MKKITFLVSILLICLSILSGPTYGDDTAGTGSGEATTGQGVSDGGTTGQTATPTTGASGENSAPQGAPTSGTSSQPASQSTAGTGLSSEGNEVQGINDQGVSGVPASQSATGTGESTGVGAVSGEASVEGGGLEGGSRDNGGIMNQQTENSYGQGHVNINTASANELFLVPGMNRSIAENIVEFRQNSGPFNSLEDLTKVQGIDEKRLNQMRDYLKLQGQTDFRPDQVSSPKLQGEGPFKEYAKPPED